jgi:ceramide glucosyltransferase
MIPHARYAHVLVNDSDISVSPLYLRRVMAKFLDHGVGLVTCLYRGVGGHTLGSRLEALGINSDFIPGVLTASLLEGGTHFGLGSTLAFQRKALDAIGGFESVADYLGDDYELGKRVSAAGFRVEIAPSIVDHYIPDYSFRDYVHHQIRWARTVHDSRPGGFAGLIFTFGFFWAIVAVVSMQGSVTAWVLFLVTVGLRIGVAFRAGAMLSDRQVRGSSWLLPIRDLIFLGIWAASYSGHRVVWRGNQFTLEKGKLRP